MKPTQLHRFLVSAFRAKRKVLIKGPPGVGKSDLVDAACEAAGAVCITRHPSVEDPTDAKGMPAITDGAKKGSKEAHFLPFGDLMRLIEADKLTVCHLEDFGQAPHSVQAAYMQLLLRRSINGTRISDHVVFTASTNDTSHKAGVNTLLEPVKSRFDTIVSCDVDVDDWCAWAYGPGKMPDALIAFIKFRPDLLSDFKPSRELTNSPSPRTVAATGRWLSDFAPALPPLEVLAGAAGEGFAAELSGFLRLYAALPSLDAILSDPLGAPVPTELAAKWAVTIGLVRRFTKDTAPACFGYAARLPKEFEVCMVRDATAQRPEIGHTREFSTWATKNGAVLSGALAQ